MDDEPLPTDRAVVVLPVNPTTPVTSWHRYEVGKLYHPSKTYWADETPHLWLSAEYGCELAMFYHGPTAAEVNAVRTGVAQFAWIDGGPQVSVLAFRFGTLNWADCPFTPHLKLPGYEPEVPALGEGEHLVVFCPLVDATTGIVKAIRLTSWTADFVAAVRASLDRMRQARFSQLAHDAALEGLYAYTTDELVAMRASARCVGGES